MKRAWIYVLAQHAGAVIVAILPVGICVVKGWVGLGPIAAAVVLGVVVSFFGGLGMEAWLKDRAKANAEAAPKTL